MKQAEKIVNEWATSRKGATLSEQLLMDGVSCRINRSKDYEESLILQIIINGQEVDSAQLELRRTGPFEWDIADRQVNDDTYKGKGILKAFVKAVERFVECLAAREKEPLQHRVFLGTAQPNVFQVFEHLGYRVRKEDENNAQLLRNPEKFPGEVVVQNAWMDAKKRSDRIELSNRDPYCFRQEALVNNPCPLPKDAVRVTLEKFIQPQEVTNKITDGVRTETRELF